MRNYIFMLVTVASVAWASSAFGESYSVECESNAYQYRDCWIGEPIKEAILQLEYAPYVCSETFTWGVEELYIWVDSGCRGWFQVITESGKTYNIRSSGK